jgi:peptide methionine sulfoxide reductase MsrB
MKQSKPIGGLTVGRPSQPPKSTAKPAVEKTTSAKQRFVQPENAVKTLQKVQRVSVIEPHRTAPTVNQLPKVLPEQVDKKQFSEEMRFTPLPPPQPFPHTILPSTLKILEGVKLELPFATEMGKEFPPRGFYACIRCQSTIVSATSKVPFDFGFSGFLDFNTTSCNVVVSATDDGVPFLQVRCGKCNGLMGELVQRRNASGKLVEALKANSCCLHFVDSDASLPKPIAKNLHQIGNCDSDSDELEMMLAELDFDDLDVIGTSDGAAKSMIKRREQHETWRRCVSAGRTTPRASVTTQQRHNGAMAALNEHSSSDDENDESESSSDEST